MNLNFGMTFPQLHTRDGLLRLDQRFLEELGFVSPELLKQLQQGRQRPDALTALQESTLLIKLGPYVENFIAKLFKIEARVAGLKMAHHELAPLNVIKRQFVQRPPATKITPEEAESIAGPSRSEFHTLKASGHAIAALAMITVDNPFVPEIETRSLKDVLELPYGFEIHSLLTRWNPLNLRREQCAVA